MQLRDYIRFYLFITLAALFVSLFTAVDFVLSPSEGLKDFITHFLQWFLMYIALWFFVYLISCSKYVFMVIYPLLNLIASILAYFRYTTATILTPMLFDAALDSATQTKTDLISWSLIIFVTGTIVISVLFSVYRYKKIKIKKIYIHCILSFCFLSFILYRYHTPISERNPFNFVFVSIEYFSERQDIATVRPSLSDGVICSEENDSLHVVFIIGESLRADHLGLNGYHRNTTPLLGKEDIVSFTNIYTPYSLTRRSIPLIFTRADSLHEERAFQERSFIDLFNTCGFYSSWFSNQQHNSSFVYFIHECDTFGYTNINKTSYVFDKWLDADLFPLFEKSLHADHLKKLMIMQTVGSHWWYNAHYPDEYEKYTPVVKSRVVSSCTKEEMINSYDNTILYTDFFLFSLLDKLRDKNAIFIYLSDHGEALGENGRWLHGFEDISMRNPACFIWMSPEYKRNHPDKYENTIKNKDRYYNVGFLFHSIIDAADIQTQYFNPELSVFR